MADSDETSYEFNEARWWSNWAETVWFDRKAYALFSRDFTEYFFNRAGFLKVPRQVDESIDTIEAEFSRRRVPAAIFLQSHSLKPRLLQELARRGYRIADQMSVMELERPRFETNPKLVLEMNPGNGLERWARVYLKAFYGDARLLRPVLSILKRLETNKTASLIIATGDAAPAGALALFRSPGLLGVYCVGTVPGMRGKHVASTMLDFANRVAVDESRKLILQTILSDSVEPFYLRLGFRRAYLKELFVHGKSLKS